MFPAWPTTREKEKNSNNHGPITISDFSSRPWRNLPPKLGKTKSTVKVRLLEYCWTPLQIYSRRSDNRTLFYQKSTRTNFRGAFEKALLEGLLTVYPNRILGFSETWVIHMATDPHGFLVWFSLERQHQVHVDRRVVGLFASRRVDHPCVGGKFRHGLLEKSLKQ